MVDILGITSPSQTSLNAHGHRIPPGSTRCPRTIRKKEEDFAYGPV